MTSSRHIGYFINQYPAVSHSFIRREIHALESLGWQVSRFAIRPDRGGVVDVADKAETQLTKHITKTPVPELISSIVKQLLFNTTAFFKTLVAAVRFNVRHEKNLKKSLICFFEACILYDWARQQGIQHIHAHFGTNSTTIAMFAKYLGGAGYSFTVHGPEEFDKPEALGLNEKIREARFVVAISSYGRSQLNRWADFADWEKIQVVHCGLDSEFLNYEPTPIPVEPRIVCVGRLSEQKGQLLLLQAIAKLVAEGVALKLVLVGDGPMRSEIERFIAGHDLDSSVELTGSLSGEQVREQISQARAFVLPSFAEGLPVVIMEALALSRPVISTYVAGIPELVSDGVNGWLVPAGSVDDLVAALRSVLNASPQTLADMAESGRLRVLEQHAIGTEARKLGELFSSFTAA
jgi:colanic acid/amylovoran biosynthesis glycosyltransferase